VRFCRRKDTGWVGLAARATKAFSMYIDPYGHLVDVGIGDYIVLFPGAFAQRVSLDDFDVYFEMVSE
jgi:hypothetical protein